MLDKSHLNKNDVKLMEIQNVLYLMEDNYYVRIFLFQWNFMLQIIYLAFNYCFKINNPQHEICGKRYVKKAIQSESHSFNNRRKQDYYIYLLVAHC